MTKKKLLFDILLITFGSSIFSVAIIIFFEPYNINPGGVTGAAILINLWLTNVKIGTIALVLNVPLFIIAWKLLGQRFLLYTIFGTAISSLILNLFSNILPTINTEPILASVAGGVLLGVGLALVFSCGATTGGSDIIARLLKIPFPHVQMGKLMLVFDGAVILISMVIFNNVNVGLYSAISLFIASKTMDAILYGFNIERLAYIISEKDSEIVQKISFLLDRGATLLHGEGSYTKSQTNVIFCAIKRQQVPVLKEIVKEIDPSAFMILTQANEVLGEGFGYFSK